MRDDGTDFLLFRKYRSDISGITTKAPCEVALMGERHVRIEISDFVMRTFVPPRQKAPSYADAVRA